MLGMLKSVKRGRGGGGLLHSYTSSTSHLGPHRICTVLHIVRFLLLRLSTTCHPHLITAHTHGTSQSAVCTHTTLAELPQFPQLLWGQCCNSSMSFTLC
jgi:hypothetical protein